MPERRVIASHSFEMLAGSALPAKVGTMLSCSTSSCELIAVLVVDVQCSSVVEHRW